MTRPSILLRRLFGSRIAPPPPLVRAPGLGEGKREGPNGSLAASSFNTQWLSELGVDPSVIVDAGSYDGGDAYRFHREFPTARVIAIEAEPVRFAIVAKALVDTPVTVVNVAISDCDGEADWYSATHLGRIDAQGSLYRQTDRMSRRAPQVKQADTPVRATTIRLDTLCREHGIEQIDLLHMDIQGAEYAALKGLGLLTPRLIFLETTKKGWIGAGPPRDVDAFLTKRGYRLAVDLRNDKLYLHEGVKLRRPCSQEAPDTSAPIPPSARIRSCQPIKSFCGGAVGF